MSNTEKNNNSLLAKQQYQEFEDNAFVIHSGIGISEGKIFQAINGKLGNKGKHTSAFIDYGASIGKSLQSIGTLHPEIQGGVFGLITHDVIPATIQETLRKDLPNHPTERRVRERLRHRIKSGISEEEYVLSQQFQKNDVRVDSVIVSHAHPDHDAILPLLSSDISVITTPETHLMQDLEQRNRPGGWVNEVVRFKEYPTDSEKREEREREYVELSQGEIYNFDSESGFYTDPIYTEHWFGSSANVIQFPDGARMLNANDLRNGQKTEVLKQYLRDTPRLDLMQVDGTHIGKDAKNYMTEGQLLEAFKKKFSKNGPYYICVNERDITRVSTIMDAAESQDKEVYVPLQLAFFIKNLRDTLGERHPDVPNLGKLTVHLQPVKSGKYDVMDYSARYRPVVTDESIKKIQQEDLHHAKPLAKNAVILFSHPKELYIFGSRSLFGRGRRVSMSTTGYSPHNPFKINRWAPVNEIVNANNMSLENMNALHHMNIEEFSEFIRDYGNAKNIIVFPSRDPQFVKHLIESQARHPINVITDIRPGVPYFLNGQSIPRKAVSYPS